MSVNLSWCNIRSLCNNIPQGISCSWKNYPTTLKIDIPIETVTSGYTRSSALLPGRVDSSYSSENSVVLRMPHSEFLH